MEPPTLDDIGFTYEDTWKVSICNNCHFVHLRTVHRFDVPNANAVLLILRMRRLRPYLAIIWDDANEDQLDESDDEGRGHSSAGISTRAQTALNANSEQRLRQICVTSKKGMPTHYRRHHKAQAVEYYSVQVQAKYGRSRTQSQALFVQVTPTETGDTTPLSTYGIPDYIHSVPGHNSIVLEREDLRVQGNKMEPRGLGSVFDDGIESRL
ncbi:hypothetical protein V1527DRAFT_502651 [Lipomyces starkeyi]